MKTTLYDQLVHIQQQQPSKVCLSDAKNNWTFTDLLDKTNSHAEALAKEGLGLGDRLLYIAGRGMNTLPLLLAANKLGVLFATIDARADQLKNQSIIDQYEADILLIAPEHAAKASYQLSYYRALDTVSLDAPSWIRNDRATGVNETNVSAQQRNRKPVASDIGLVFFTSGSTGRSKGVALSHSNVLFAAQSIIEYLEIDGDDVIYNALPLNFDYGFYQILFPLFTGCQTFLTNSFMIPQKNLMEVQKISATHFPIVPSMARLIKQFGSAKQLESVTTITNTGEAIHRGEVEYMQTIFTNCRFFSMYGLTECKRTTWLHPDEYAKKPDSVGIAIPGTRIEILDENNQPVPAGTEGQIVVSGPHVMTEYLDNPDATRKAIFFDENDRQKKLATGDFGRMDSDGYLYLSGRKDEVFKIDGLKYSCKEHEQWMKSQPEIRDACILVNADTMAITAFIVEEVGESMSDELLRERLLKRSALSSHLPKRVERLVDIPINDNGKHNKQKLKQALLDGDLVEWQLPEPITHVQPRQLAETL
ncbi:class I adenylate-forming enzyme family protein [Enterovibrio norvegicus]|uniref:class I adenylate-forming enzyme family protein n=1 Tax=Enterovibrio norvegicus TaxID=188144 RepID=UPI0013D503DA|nr:class I adenylate-forming enzyme family protein [Enterovibrio norvegicus]